MKILLLGITYSEWTKNFIDHFLLPSHYHVWMICKEYKVPDRKYITYYKKRGIHLIDCADAFRDIYDGKYERNCVKALNGHIKLIRAVAKHGPFDAINLHFVRYPELIDACLLKVLMGSRLILSYWGSDLLRVDDKKLLSSAKYIQKADLITFDNKDLEHVFYKKFVHLRKSDLKTIRFGLPILDLIQKKYNSKLSENIRNTWNITKDKTVIAIGYNGIPEQQHIAVLKQIKALDERFKKNIILLIQMTYGGTEGYKDIVTKAVSETGCEHIVIRRFLSEDEVADLRIATDIFINAQTTDAFSGSVCENLYAGTTLINARWLRYQEFLDYDFKYLEFETMQELPALIERAMAKKFDTAGNRDLVWKLRSWQYCSLQWKEAFHETLSKKSPIRKEKKFK